jgi:hypothetical protein
MRVHVCLQIEAFSSWLDTEVAKQGKLAPHAEPTLVSEGVESRLADVRTLFNKLNAKKKPKPAAAAPEDAEAAKAGEGSAEEEEEEGAPLDGEGGQEQGGAEAAKDEL